MAAPQQPYSLTGNPVNQWGKPITADPLGGAPTQAEMTNAEYEKAVADTKENAPMPVVYVPPKKKGGRRSAKRKTHRRSRRSRRN